MAMHDCERGLQLAQLLGDDDVDAAIQAGLMDFVPCPCCTVAAAAKIAQARQRLSRAWAARERFRARETRLARIAAERAARRAPPQAQKASQQPQAGHSALPPAAAAILARAKAKAAQRNDQ